MRHVPCLQRLPTCAVAARWLVSVIVAIFKLKKESCWIFLACEIPKAADRCQQAKGSAATVVAYAQTQVWERFGELVT